MAFWSDWSDGKKWVMGIIATVGSSLAVTAVAHSFMAVPTERAPLAQADYLAKPAKLIVEHIGGKDPEYEGFVNGYALAPDAQKRQWKSIRMTPAQDPPAWHIENPVLGAVPYRFPLGEELREQARTKGWRITLRARLIRLFDPDGGFNANVYTGVRRYDLNVVRVYPRLPQNQQLHVRLNTQILDAKATDGVSGKELIDGSQSHMFVMAYEPSSSLARVYVDDRLLLEAKYEGHTDFNRDRPFFTFGSSGAEATFENARFEVFR